ncbi:MAG: hypothetical protein IPM95_00160 [Sphingobacteriales bacterium]|jgi:hypothetical protein|nr:hypothetical protein [Sphingobacteriales bacterium]
MNKKIFFIISSFGILYIALQYSNIPLKSTYVGVYRNSISNEIIELKEDGSYNLIRNDTLINVNKWKIINKLFSDIDSDIELEEYKEDINNRGGFMYFIKKQNCLYTDEESSPLYCRIK